MFSKAQGQPNGRMKGWHCSRGIEFTCFRQADFFFKSFSGYKPPFPGLKPPLFKPAVYLVSGFKPGTSQLITILINFNRL